MEIILLGILGAAFGSFLCAWMYREEGYDTVASLGNFFKSKAFNKDFIFGRSFCDVCKKELKFFDLIPIFSFLFLRGKCRYCGIRINKRTIFLEIFCAAIFILAGFFAYFSGLSDPSGLFLVVSIIFTAFALVFFFFDYYYSLVPDSVAIIGGSAFLLFWFFFGQLNSKSMISYIAAALAGYLFFMGQHVLSKGRWIGKGDAYLGFFFGAALGIEKFILCLILAYIIGAVVAILLLALKKKKMSDVVPFGSFLSLGALASWFFGNFLL